MRDEGAEKAERFSSGGHATGVIGLAVTALLLGYGVLVPDVDYAPWAWPLLLLIGILLWAVLMRPALIIRGDTLELREIVHSRWIPVARVTDVAITHVTRIGADGHTYVSNGVGRSRREIVRDERRGGAALTEDHSVGWLVEQKVQRLAARAREAQELSDKELPEPRLTWAWPEIGAIVALSVATLGLVLV